MRRMSMVAVAVALVSVGCGPAGSGRIVTEARDLPAFQRISIEEGLDLVVELVPGAVQQVSVTYDDSVIHLIGTEVTDGQLHIEIIDSFRVTGGGRFVTVVTGDLDVLFADSGADVRVGGEADDLSVVATGGAALDLSLLVVRSVTVDVSGAAFVAVGPSESVDGTARSGAEVVVLGTPSTIDITTSGGATLVTP